MHSARLFGLAVLAPAAFLAAPAGAALMDWNVNPGGAYFPANTYANWKPDGGANPNNAFAVATGTSSDIHYAIWDGYGMHGNGNFGQYKNARNFGGQLFDVKAMYSRISGNDLVVGIVSGVNPAGFDDPDTPATIHYLPGDLAIQPNWAANTAAYGVLLPELPAGSSGTTDVVAGGIWNIPTPILGPGVVPLTNYQSGGSTAFNNVQYSYSDLGISYYDSYTNKNVPVYLTELTIPLTNLQQYAGKTIQMSWGVSCSNDSLSIEQPLPVPEPASAGLLAAASLLALRRRR